MSMDFTNVFIIGVLGVVLFLLFVTLIPLLYGLNSTRKKEEHNQEVIKEIRTTTERIHNLEAPQQHTHIHHEQIPQPTHQNAAATRIQPAPTRKFEQVQSLDKSQPTPPSQDNQRKHWSDNWR